MDETPTKEKTLKERIEEYHEKIGKAVKLDVFNYKELQMDLPNQRHYWVGMLMQHKCDIINLQKQRKKAIKILSDKKTKDSPIGLSARTIKEAAEDNDIVKKIDEKIVEEELLIEYLEKIEANFRSISWDIGHLIDIIKLETT